MVTKENKPKEIKKPSSIFTSVKTMRGRKIFERKDEFEQKVLDIARVARVVAGGRRFSFRALVAIGDRHGRVGIGLAKGKDVSQAIEKANNQAKKQLISVVINKGTICHDTEADYGAAKVLLKSASKGTGLVAGSVVRVICNLVGISDMVGKILSRSTNKINNARATIVALKKLKSQTQNSNF